jgi:4-carboxymuconolactone decarboxylase
MSAESKTVSRIGGVAEAGDDEILKDIYSHILAKRGFILNIHQVVAHSPKMLRAQARYAASLREESSLPRDLQELLIMRIAQVNDSHYEQSVHHPIALNCGVRPEQLEGLPNWRASGAFDDKERAALSFVDQAAANGEVDEMVFAQAQAQFSAREIVDLAALVGWYVGNSRFVRALRIVSQA